MRVDCCLAYLAMDFMSSGRVLATSTSPVVEYTFNDISDPTKSTGFGDSLDGVLYPSAGHGISFPDDDGNGDAVASFVGTGCIQVPSSDLVNLDVVNDRSISLDFVWDGTRTSNDEPQILFEEGGKENGINIYLTPNISQGTAELVMGVWEGPNEGTNDPQEPERMLLCTKAIAPNRRYNAGVVLDRTTPQSPLGTVTGYLDGEEYASQDIDFFAIKAHSGDNCVGGMMWGTRIFPTNGDPSYKVNSHGGLYFNGLIDNFKLFNSNEIPPAPPSSSPSLSPTLTPMPSLSSSPTSNPTSSVSPSSDPTSMPSLSPSSSASPSSVPTSMPSLSPSSSANPSSDPTSMPSLLPSSSPTSSLSPSSNPTSIPSLSPSSQPSVMPSKSSMPSLSSHPSSMPSVSLMPSMAPTQDPLLVVEYTFGDGGAIFPGDSCIEVAKRDEINGGTMKIGDRTIALDFRWDGTTNSNLDPQILFEEGGRTNGINLFLDLFSQNSARLVLAVWETGEILKSASVSTTILARKWYHTALVLDRFGDCRDCRNGSLEGYLNGIRFGTSEIAFFPINPHSALNCIGGMKAETLIVDSSGGNATGYLADGFFFHGQIDNFRFFNSVQIPSLAWEQITYDGFEGGWGNFVKIHDARNKMDAARFANAGSSQAKYVPRGNAALRVRDNSGIASSVFHKANHNVTGYSNLRVYFEFSSRNMDDSNDSFVLEYSSSGDANYTVVKEFVYGNDFENDVFFYNVTVDFDASGTTYELTDEARIRFRCDAGHGDYIYIDEVKFEGQVLVRN